MAGGTIEHYKAISDLEEGTKKENPELREISRKLLENHENEENYSTEISTEKNSEELRYSIGEELEQQLRQEAVDGTYMARFSALTASGIMISGSSPAELKLLGGALGIGGLGGMVYSAYMSPVWESEEERKALEKSWDIIDDLDIDEKREAYRLKYRPD